MRTVGTLSLNGGHWRLTAEPHVVMMAKRIFKKIDKTTGVIAIPNTPEVARDLEWFTLRYPLIVENADELRSQSQKHIDGIVHRDAILSGTHKPRKFKMALKPRDYQTTAAEVMLSSKAMILGDQVGLGKTCTALCVIAQPECQPAVIVVPSHLAQQWKREINRFLPKMTVHIVKQTKHYDVRNRKGVWPDVIIVTYSKLRYWSKVLAENCKTVIYEEIQEVRRSESQKHQAALIVSSAMEYRFGLSGSPVYNYGGEFYNVYKVIDPGALGTSTEFLREWCGGMGMSMKPRLTNSDAFGSWLKENHMMLRRTRTDVKRELPELTTVTHFVEPDMECFKKSKDRANELARILLEGTERGSQFHAAGEFDALMRQTTGISKAVAVASFVEMLLKTGEPVVLFGWHRACFARGTKAIKYDGTTINVEDVVVGDVLMGPDSSPRTVKSLTQGRGKMFKIIPNKGQSWICSEHHTLSVKCYSGEVKKFTVGEYIKRTKRWQRDNMLYRSAAIDFGKQTEAIEPWFLGYWLGNGAASLKDLRISTIYAEVYREMLHIASRFNLSLSTWDNPGVTGTSECKQVAFSTGMKSPRVKNELILHFRRCGLHKNKRIPHEYMTASIDDRRELLAGLIDSDGHTCVGNGVGTVEYSSVSFELSSDVAFLARSLGFSANIALQKHREHNVLYGRSRGLYKTFISGDLTVLPMRVEKKKGLPRAGQKNVLHTGFTIEQVEDDEFFGFEVDSDHLFLLDDFTVVHNCYEIWLSELSDYKPAMYTGSESPAKKDAEVQRFTSGETNLLIMSLRSGVGVDGLQARCRTVVVGELDWSPAIIEQNIGRVSRDGQTEPVMAYILVTDSGADPYMLEVLGIKQDQVDGIRCEARVLEKKTNSMDVMKSLARRYLESSK